MLGISTTWIITLLLLALPASLINIPLTTVQAPSWFGRQKSSAVGVNLGGAVLPALLSLYLILHTGLYRATLKSLTIVIIITYCVARMKKPEGILLPIFLPGLTAATSAFVLAQDPQTAPRVAYVAGTLGPLVGADLLNLNRMPKIGSHTAIGGAGVFDGVFITGIMAVLIVAIARLGIETLLR